MSVPVKAEHGFVDLTRDELVAWGRNFAASLQAPALVALSGELGAGKTTLVQSICAALGVNEPVTSPTFALVHSYRGAATQVFHLDLFRLNSPAELTNIGWDEMLDARAIVLVEWPDRAGSALPGYATKLALWHLPDAPDKRRIIW
jgi:tRNA threonylcarbamoyladenosine biosynthesis protein TsaE